MPFLMRCPILENASRTSESEEKEQSFFFFFFARGGKEENGFSGQTGYFLSLSTSETAGVVV